MRALGVRATHCAGLSKAVFHGTQYMNMNIDIKKLIRSQKFGGMLVGFCTAIVALVIFQAGMFVGFHKAGFSRHMGDNYYRAFGKHHRMPGIQIATPGDFVDVHGAAGRVVSVSLPTTVIQDGDGIEKVVHISENTAVRRLRNDVTPTDIKVGDFAVVIGKPNDVGQVEATLIRLLPPPTSQ